MVVITNKFYSLKYRFFKIDFKGEKENWNSGRVIVLKWHPILGMKKFPMNFVKDTPAIFLIRNPNE